MHPFNLKLFSILLTLFQSYTVPIVHSSNFTLFQFYILPILHSYILPTIHSSNLTLPMQSYTLAVVGAFSVIDRIDVDGGVDVDEGGEDEHHWPGLLISGDRDSQLLNTRRRLPRQWPVTSRAVNEVSRKFYNINFFTVCMYFQDAERPLVCAFSKSCERWHEI